MRLAIALLARLAPLAMVGMATLTPACRRHRAVVHTRAPVAQQTLSASKNRTCLVQAGRVACVGQLGQRVTFAPVAIAGTEGALAVDDGGAFVCLIRGDRTVACFGDHAVPVPGVADAVQLAIGRAHGCARLADGHVACWAMNAPATRVAGLDSVSGLATAGDVTCAVRRDRGVWCWGGSFGARPARFDAGVDSPPSRNVALAAQHLPDPMGCSLEGRVVACRGAKVIDDAAELAASPDHACARRTNGEVLCWGDDSFGQLGDRDQADGVPRRVEAGPGALVMGGSLACTVGEQPPGDVRCWSAVPPFAPPAVVPELTGSRGLARGRDHACAIGGASAGGGALRCFGLARVGQLGFLPDDGAWAVAAPTAVPGLSDVTDVTVGDAATCARAADRVLCFGSNSAGELALGTSSLMVATPTEVPALRGARRLALGAHHLCALLPDATVACAGSNGSGELGSERAGSSPLLVAVPGLDRVVDVQAAGNHTCVRRDDGEVLCFGLRFRSPHAPWGGKGKDWFDRPQPIARDAISLAVARAHACFVGKDGLVRCLGDNDDGSCGAPIDGEVTAPRVVAGVRDAVEVRAAEHATCARTKTSEVLCWGRDRAEGNPETVARQTPVRLRL